jgi:hypothetical protein
MYARRNAIAPEENQKLQNCINEIYQKLEIEDIITLDLDSIGDNTFYWFIDHVQEDSPNASTLTNNLPLRALDLYQNLHHLWHRTRPPCTQPHLR